jgi:outer membrane immunogenic protein
MRKRIVMLALGAAVGAVTAAMAADMGKQSNPPYEAYEPDFSWAGPYVGLHGGAAIGASYDSEEPRVPLGGHYIGAHMGLNAIVAGNIVLGVEGSFSSSSVAGQVQYVDADPFVGVSTLTERINWIASLRARAGLAMDGWMPYVTAGVAQADSTRTTGLLQTLTHGHSGWTIGAGVEWMLTPQWILRGEYRYYSFRPATYNWAAGGPSAVDFNFNTFEFGFNYKF